jgi:hypothetical protein
MILHLILIPLALVYGFLATAFMARRFRGKFDKPNFLGNAIPTAYGLVFVLAATLYYGALSAFNRVGGAVDVLYFVTIVGFGLLGLLDDLAGDRSVGGLKGHLAALVKGKVTTGAVKAIGGVALALAVGWLLHPGSLLAVIAGVIVAGTSNTLNLVDLRPGRCLAAFFVGSVPMLFALAPLAHHGHGLSVMPVAFTWIAAAVLLPPERAGRVMLGDTGATSFGAALGLGYAVYVTDLKAQLALVFLIVVFHLWTEHNSLSQLIARTPWLSRLDRKLGVR